MIMGSEKLLPGQRNCFQFAIGQHGEGKEAKRKTDYFFHALIMSFPEAFGSQCEEENE